jgi:hypothetical protein
MAVTKKSFEAEKVEAEKADVAKPTVEQRADTSSVRELTKYRYNGKQLVEFVVGGTNYEARPGDEFEFPAGSVNHPDFEEVTDKK